MPIRACVFDAYGTLFDVNAAARRAAATPEGVALGQHWPRLAADWRAKQLQYTWLRAITGEHADFRQVTADALDWALEAAGLASAAADRADAVHGADAKPDRLRETLLALYERLDAYPEVPAALDALAARGQRLAILSNGSPAMLAAAVGSAKLDGRFEALLSVEAVGVFKPDARVYRLVPDRLGVAPGETLFVSANGWDAAGAAGFGFVAAWVNRAGEPLDRLPHRPRHTVPDLASLPALLGSP